MNNINITTRKTLSYYDTTIKIGNYEESAFLNEKELEDMMRNIAIDSISMIHSNKDQKLLIRNLAHMFDMTIDDIFSKENNND